MAEYSEDVEIGVTKSELEQLFLLQMQAAGLPAPVQEYKFALGLGRRWRFDFCWPERMVAVEVEGGSWTQGRHTRGAGFENDCEKYNAAALLGWMVLRVTGDMVRDGRALRYTEQALGGMSGIGDNDD